MVSQNGSSKDSEQRLQDTAQIVDNGEIVLDSISPLGFYRGLQELIEPELELRVNMVIKAASVLPLGGYRCSWPFLDERWMESILLKRESSPGRTRPWMNE